MDSQDSWFYTLDLESIPRDLLVRDTKWTSHHVKSHWVVQLLNTPSSSLKKQVKLHYDAVKHLDTRKPQFVADKVKEALDLVYSFKQRNPTFNENWSLGKIALSKQDAIDTILAYEGTPLPPKPNPSIEAPPLEGMTLVAKKEKPSRKHFKDSTLEPRPLGLKPEVKFDDEESPTTLFNVNNPWEEYKKPSMEWLHEHPLHALVYIPPLWRKTEVVIKAPTEPGEDPEKVKEVTSVEWKPVSKGVFYKVKDLGRGQLKSIYERGFITDGRFVQMIRQCPDERIDDDSEWPIPFADDDTEFNFEDNQLREVAISMVDAYHQQCILAAKGGPFEGKLKFLETARGLVIGTNLFYHWKAAIKFFDLMKSAFKKGDSNKLNRTIHGFKTAFCLNRKVGEDSVKYKERTEKSRIFYFDNDHAEIFWAAYKKTPKGQSIVPQKGLNDGRVKKYASAAVRKLLGWSAAPVQKASEVATEIKKEADSTIEAAVSIGFWATLKAKVTNIFVRTEEELPKEGLFKRTKNMLLAPVRWAKAAVNFRPSFMLYEQKVGNEYISKTSWNPFYWATAPFRGTKAASLVKKTWKAAMKPKKSRKGKEKEASVLASSSSEEE
jgi:hypothetical protein